MRVSIRRGYSAIPEVISCTWDQFVTFMKASAGVQYPTKEDQPHLMLCATRGSFRAADIDPEGFWAIALDYDDVDADRFAAAVVAAQGLCQGLAHTTWGHCVSEKGAKDGSSVRGRIIIALEEPCPIGSELAARIAIGMRIENRSGAAPDPETLKSSARFWFAPGTNPSAPTWAKPCWVDSW